MVRIEIDCPDGIEDCATMHYETVDAELLPCPFCGSGAEVVKGVDFGIHLPRLADLYQVGCIQFKCVGKLGTYYKTAIAAINAWNRRIKC